MPFQGLGLVVFDVLVKANLIRGQLQKLRMTHVAPDILHEACIVSAGTDSLVNGYANGEKALHTGVAVFHHGAPLLQSHSDEYAHITPVVQMVVDILKLDGVLFHDDWGSQRAPFFSLDVCMEMVAAYLKQIVGKTGTAQTSANNNVDIENTSWFVAVTPREDPQIVVVVLIPNGLSGSASHVAVEDIVSWWYENRANEEQLSAEQPETAIDPELEELLQPDEEMPEEQEPLPEAETIPEL